MMNLDEWRDRCPAWVIEAWEKLTADKKKLSLMVGLLAVALLLWGRLMLKQPPRTATAEPEPAAARSGYEDLSSFSLDTVYVDLPERLERNLFGLDPSAYENKPRNDEEAGVEDKSSPELADEQERIRETASRLRLRTTILGQAPRAVINGRALAPGETIEGFVVLEIRAREVVLEREGRRIRLAM